jgi:hypothetical protein
VLATLQPVVLWEFEALLVQVLLLLLLVPLRHVIEFFGGLHYVFGRWKEHAPPPWEVNQRHQKSISRIKESDEDMASTRSWNADPI